MTSRLTTTDHNRDMIGHTYIYPVNSRRAGGLSIGINVNTNNACNWRCVYCQVPNLSKGAAPAIDFELLRAELQAFLKDVLQGDFYDRYEIDTDKRVIKDIAISGNGEPTSADEFDRLVTVVGAVAQGVGLLPGIKLILITNGSLIHRPVVQQGLTHWHTLGGEVWFKLDSATLAGKKRINNSQQTLASALHNLRLAAELCTTKIQTCLLDYAGVGWSEAEQAAYLDFLGQVQDLPRLRDVMLYTLARPSYQPEAPQLKALAPEVMQRFADKISRLGFTVSLY